MASRKKQRGEEFKQEDVLQAVVIADSFNVRFAPITKLKPRTLLPLANVPLLEYTLEFLLSAGIQEVIVFCCIHANQIKEHLAKSKWGRESSPMEIITIVSEDCLSVGDALRDIDAKSLISSDFVLVNGDMVANVNLKPIIEQHKARRLKDKATMMTMLMRKAPPCHRIRCTEDEVILAIKPDNNRVLSYQKLGGTKKLDFPLEIFTENKTVELRYDLLDTHICICSPHVPHLFTDNFDYLSRDDFVRGILVDEEILGNSIHIHELNDQYAARVSNLQMYDSISKDVLTRWVYPMVPDCAVTDSKADHYTYGRHNIYLHKDITLARGCKLLENVMIGKGSSVGSDTVITNSVIGQNCTIGENVKLDGAYIWDGVEIDDNCDLAMCIVDTSVHLRKNVNIKCGCVLASEVVVGPNVTLDNGVMLTSVKPEPEWEDEETSSPVIDHVVVGEEGCGYVYEAPAPDSEDEDYGEELVQEMWGMRIESEEEETESVISEFEADEDDDSGSPIPDEPKMFFEEVISTLERDLVENIGRDNMILEVNSVKHAYGIQIQEVNQLLTKAIMALPFQANPQIEPPQYLTQTKSNLLRFSPLLKNYIRSEESQMDCLISLEEFCLTNGTAQRVLVKVIHHLYEEDIMSEEPILEWHQDPETDDHITKRKEIRKQVEPFITWLKEADEESDED